MVDGVDINTHSINLYLISGEKSKKYRSGCELVGFIFYIISISYKIF
jgi:hypothetical protein